jgi:hypothetical protein
VSGSRRVRAERGRGRQRPTRWAHARPRAPLLPGAVPAERRAPEPLCNRQRRGRARHGHLRHDGATDLHVPPRTGAPALRDRRRLLPGRVRRLVPQPPVAGCRGDAGLAERSERRLGERPPLPRRRERHAEQLSALHLTARHGREGSPADRLVLAAGGSTPDAGRCDVRRLRGQHDAAVVSAVRAGNGRREAAAPADEPDDRRPPLRRRRRLGLVLGRLVERQRRRRRPRLDKQLRPGLLRTARTTSGGRGHGFQRSSSLPS